jgi:argininosuccinate lyase
MARDATHNIYVTLGIPRDSHLYQALSEDIAETGLTRSQVMTMRLADYYRFGNVPGRTAHESFAQMVDQRQGEGIHDGAEEQENLASRAREAAAAWAFDDE